MKRRFLRYLSREIAIEYKACLYFFGFLTFYAIYLICHQVYTVGILPMFEMIISTYFVGYLQVYVLWNFDEAERLGKKELLAALLCTGIYTAVSVLFGWFDRSPRVSLLFFIYVLFCYLCVYLINKVKRKIDTEQLNELLEAYKKGESHGGSGTCD